MKPGDVVRMHHPDGYATITGGGGTFVGWVPNGIPGLIYLLTPDEGSAVVYGPSDVESDPRNAQGAVVYVLDLASTPDRLVLVELVVWNAF